MQIQQKTVADKVSLGTLFVALGIVFGDIGTSPLYVFTAITGGQNFDPLLIYGSLSCVFWTLVIIASIKYIYLTLDADNAGEGGIFALYALLRRYKKRWIIYPALIGCAALISDGFITPAISISSAVEGLKNIVPDLPTIPIVLIILSLLFLLQQFGTNTIGRFFGPIMLVWFITIGLLGLSQFLKNPKVIEAFHPKYVYLFFANYPGAIWVLGAVFLCTTGAEALYSDLGHCGKNNIRISWGFVSIMLLLNYLGQAAYCLSLPKGVTTTSIFYSTVPKPFLLPVIIVATLATIIASQALITGIFTLVSEAMKLKLWTDLRVKYTSTHKGQVYIPFINGFLYVGCVVVVLLFQKSSNMEAAYGLAITLNMLVTTLLLGSLLLVKGRINRKPMIWASIIVFLIIEAAFFYSSLSKLSHGGWFTALLTGVFFFLFYMYHRAKILRRRFMELSPMGEILPVIEAVSMEDKVPYFSTNIVYPTRSQSPKFLDDTIIYSLFHKLPKRAKVYWFVHLDTTDLPYGVEYKFTRLIPQKCFFINLYVGFKEPHNMDAFIQQIHKQLIIDQEVDGKNAFETLNQHGIPADFKYVVINSRVASDQQLSMWEVFMIRTYRFIKSIGLSRLEDFGLSEVNTIQELIPINIGKSVNATIKERIKIE